MRHPFFRIGSRPSVARERNARHAGADIDPASPRLDCAAPADPPVFRVAVVTDVRTDALSLAASLTESGHEVSVVECGAASGGDSRRDTDIAGPQASDSGLQSLLKYSVLPAGRPDRWWALGRRLRHIDAVVVLEGRSAPATTRQLVLTLARSVGALRRGAGPIIVPWPRSAPDSDIEVLLRQIRHQPEKARVHEALPETPHLARDAAARGRRSPRSSLRYSDVSAHAQPSSVLIERRDAIHVRRWARRGGLRASNPQAAWDAAGALAALLLVDRGHRRVALLDRSGPQSPIRRWAARLGFEVLETGPLLDASGARGSLDIPAGSVDVLTHLYPALVSPPDVDVVLADAARQLRTGGLLVLTLALVASGPEAFGPAELHALVARAHEQGFVLVGNVDADLALVVREGQWAARVGETFGLVRLTLRRRG